MDKIGVTGHSSDGWGALVGASAPMDLGWCTAHPDIVTKTEQSNCAQFVPHQQDIASALGLKSVPAGLWPAMNDPRVAAVVTMAPDGDIWGAEYQGVAPLKVPALILNGSGDTRNVPERKADPNLPASWQREEESHRLRKPGSLHLLQLSPRYAMGKRHPVLCWL
jgi:predicted dienelactone hydrolase